MPYNPMLQQQIAQLDQEYTQKKSNIIQSFYQSQQNNNWNNQNMNTQQQAQTVINPVQNVNWVYVSGVDGAKNQIVQPGQTVWMMDNNDPYFYVKAVDNVGSSSLRIFQFAEVQETTPEQPTQQIDLSGYVPRGEFDALKEQVEQLSAKQAKPSVKASKGAEDNG